MAAQSMLVLQQSAVPAGIGAALLGVASAVREKLSWQVVLAAAATSLAGLLTHSLLSQYAPLLRLRRRLPPMDVGAPLIGHTHAILTRGFWGAPGMPIRELREKMGPAFVTNFLFENVVIVDYGLYEKYLHRLELAGELVPDSQANGLELIGRNSIIFMPAGRGAIGAAHKRLRRRVYQAFVPKQLLLMLPQVEGMCRATLEAMAEETAQFGQARLEKHVGVLALKVACASILGRLADSDLPHLDHIRALCKTVIDGVIALPIDLGPLTALGRARRARRELCDVLDKLVALAKEMGGCEEDGKRNVLGRLASPTVEGEDPLSPEEIQDTLVTLAIAGQLTTSDAIPATVCQLANHQEWVPKIAADPPRFEASLEYPNAGLQFLREAIRLRPPVIGFRRSCPHAWVDLGEHGSIPPGWSILTLVDYPTYQAGGEAQTFDPTRWTAQAAKESFHVFGGNTPHACVGKNLALMEMQVFIHMLCRDYDFKVLPDELAPGSALMPAFKQGLPMCVWHKSVAAHAGA